MKARLMPAFFIACKSAIAPSLEILSLIQYQNVPVRMLSGGDIKPSSRVVFCCACEILSAERKRMKKRHLIIIGILNFQLDLSDFIAIATSPVCLSEAVMTSSEGTSVVSYLYTILLLPTSLEVAKAMPRRPCLSTAQ